MAAEVADFFIPDVSVFVQVYSMEGASWFSQIVDDIGATGSFESCILKGSLSIIENEIYSQKYFGNGLGPRSITVFEGMKVDKFLARVLNYFDLRHPIQEGIDSLRAELRQFSTKYPTFCERALGGKSIFIMTIDVNREAWGYGERIGFVWVQFSPNGKSFLVSTVSERSCPRGVGPMDIRLAVRKYLMNPVRTYTKRPNRILELLKRYSSQKKK
jgi:hypothetical protein